MIETVKYLPVDTSTNQEVGPGNTSLKQGHDLLFELYELDSLQVSVCIFFYYNEFMENARTLFQESTSQ